MKTKECHLWAVPPVIWGKLPTLKTFTRAQSANSHEIRHPICAIFHRNLVWAFMWKLFEFDQFLLQNKVARAGKWLKMDQISAKSMKNNLILRSHGPKLHEIVHNFVEKQLYFGRSPRPSGRCNALRALLRSHTARLRLADLSWLKERMFLYLEQEWN